MNSTNLTVTLAPHWSKD